MSDWDGDLTDILEKEEALLRSILQKATSKTDALRHGDVTGLDAIVNEEQLLSLQLEAAERKRLRLLGANGMERLNLSEIVIRAGDQYAGRLAGLLDAMTAAADEIRRINALNADLTRVVLEFYGKYMSPVRVTYENNGKSRNAPETRGFIDKKF